MPLKRHRPRVSLPNLPFEPIPALLHQPMRFCIRKMPIVGRLSGTGHRHSWTVWITSDKLLSQSFVGDPSSFVGSLANGNGCRTRSAPAATADGRKTHRFRSQNNWNKNHGLWLISASMLFVCFVNSPKISCFVRVMCGKRWRIFFSSSSFKQFLLTCRSPWA